MIIQLKNTVSSSEASQLAIDNKAFHIVSDGNNVLITGSGVKEVPAILQDKTDKSWVFANDIQLASKNYDFANSDVAFISTEDTSFENVYNSVLKNMFLMPSKYEM